MVEIPRLTLGTAQLGPAYGIANREGHLDDTAADALLTAGWEVGMRWLDTARAYGESETRIGAWCRAHGHRPTIVTKIAAGEPVADEIDRSAAALGQDPAYVLAHRSSDLEDTAFHDGLRRAVDGGRIRAFGASVYTPEEAFGVIETDGVSMLQLPFNILDRRMADSGLLAEAGKRNVIVLARSIYLQGVLLMPLDALPDHLGRLRAPLTVLRALGADMQALALATALNEPGIASCVIGVETPAQIAQLAAPSPIAPAMIAAAIEIGRGLPEALIDPSRWPRAQ
ncbi:MAG: aldo/keto reductase [Alphaproteobacteria bacterium]|jgi:aryl-alcohol dehydrogenase-like predicted oxidoreductase|nr:aldo/keto reductase [Alphaproteobacteria bacterium]